LSFKQQLIDGIQSIERWAQAEDFEFVNEAYRQHRKDEKLKEFIKQCYKAHQEFIAYIEAKYGEELQRVREMWFPLGWMLKDKAIMRTFMRYPMILPGINYIHNLTRFPNRNKIEFKKMIEINREVLGNKKYRGHEYSSFVSNNQFYEEMRAHCNLKVDKDYSIPAYKKLILKLYEMEALKRLGRIKTGRRGLGGILYADGYYTFWGETKMVKHSFLKDIPQIKRFLRGLKLF
jgi:hypothetical protein